MAGSTGQVGRNEVLACFLVRAGWSPENLGERLNELAARLGLRARINPRSVRRWVYGDTRHPVPRVPREPWPALVCLLLHERLGEPVNPPRCWDGRWIRACSTSRPMTG